MWLYVIIWYVYVHIVHVMPQWCILVRLRHAKCVLYGLYPLFASPSQGQPLEYRQLLLLYVGMPKAMHPPWLQLEIRGCFRKENCQNCAWDVITVDTSDRRKFRSQTSDNMDRWKAEMGRVREEEERRSKRESLRRKKIQVREKVGKSGTKCVFAMFCGSGGSKSRLAKAAGAEPAGQMRDEKLHSVIWHEAHVQVKMHKTPQLRSTFRSWDVEKVHACVARSTFPSQNVQNPEAPDHFRKLRVEMSKKCTPLWREAHFEFKSATNWGVRSIFGRSDVVLRGRRKEGFAIDLESLEIDSWVFPTIIYGGIELYYRYLIISPMR